MRQERLRVGEKKRGRVELMERGREGKIGGGKVGKR